MNPNATIAGTPSPACERGGFACSDLLGVIEPDPIGQILGTGYMRFESPTGLDGLAKWTDERLDLLAVVTRTPGKGCFREFIRRAQAVWQTVCVWHDDNPLVGHALFRYGFTPETEILADGEVVSGWRWDKTPNDQALPPGDTTMKPKQDTDARAGLAPANVRRRLPRGLTFLCPWCESRVSSKRYGGCNDAKTGKPVCMDCEESL
jgi:hypothetical protein